MDVGARAETSAVDGIPKRKEVKTMSERQIVNRVKKLRELEEQKAQLEKEIGALKIEIQSQMQDTEEIRAGRFIVRWTSVSSQRLDTTALKKAYAGICKRFTKSVESRRFSIVEA